MKPRAEIIFYSRRRVDCFENNFKLKVELFALWAGGLFAELKSDVMFDINAPRELYKPFYLENLIVIAIASCYSLHSYRDSVIVVRANFIGFLISLFYRYFVHGFCGWLTRLEFKHFARLLKYKEDELLPWYSPTRWINLFYFYK